MTGISSTSQHQPRQNAGFSLLELLTTLTVLGIALAIAVPNFSQLIAGQKNRTVASDVFGSTIVARSEAIKRNTTISMVRSGTDWANGWTVQTSGGTVLQRQDPYTNMVINGPGSGTVTYGWNGRPTAGSVNASFTIYASSYPTLPARCLILSLSGMPQLKADTDGNPANGC